jgi:hypothetical protein
VPSNSCWVFDEAGPSLGNDRRQQKHGPFLHTLELVDSTNL